MYEDIARKETADLGYEFDEVNVDYAVLELTHVWEFILGANRYRVIDPVNDLASYALRQEIYAQAKAALDRG